VRETCAPLPWPATLKWAERPLMTISPDGARLLGQQVIRNAKEALARAPKIRRH
jgi:hypothetical protein